MPSPSNRIALAKRDIKQIRKNIRTNRRTRIAEAFSPKKNTLRLIDPSTGKAGKVVIGGKNLVLNVVKGKKTRGYGGTTQEGTVTSFDFMKGRRKEFTKTVTGRDKTGKEIGTTEIKKVSRKGKVKTKTRKSLRAFERADRAAQAPGKKGTRGGLQRTLTPKVNVRPSDLAPGKAMNTFVTTKGPIPRHQSELKRKRKQLRKGSLDGEGNFVKGIRQFKQDKRAGRTDVKLKVTAPILPSGTVNITKKENRLARKNYRKFGTAIASTTVGKQGNKENAIERQFGYKKPSMLKKKRKSHV